MGIQVPAQKALANCVGKLFTTLESLPEVLTRTSTLMITINYKLDHANGRVRALCMIEMCYVAYYSHYFIGDAR